MDMLTITVFFICFFFLSFVNYSIIYDIWKRWIVKKDLIKIFPKWNNSNKPLYWTLLWNLIILSGYVAFIVVAVFTKSREILGLAALCDIIVFLPFVGLIYLIVKFLIIAHQNKD